MKRLGFIGVSYKKGRKQGVLLDGILPSKVIELLTSTFKIPSVHLTRLVVTPVFKSVEDKTVFLFTFRERNTPRESLKKDIKFAMILFI
ncbi:hypothetical protein [Mariniflexile fucanivorans]|uniref:hypothetical protein n=1 Tax=Mariniflexile fucanivorans TaxID=264023 RepID=UPI00104B5209|nr:hypothetical protein [Mariniflexile fucanivorans]